MSDDLPAYMPRRFGVDFGVVLHVSAVSLLLQISSLPRLTKSVVNTLVLSNVRESKGGHQPVSYRRSSLRLCRLCAGCARGAKLGNSAGEAARVLSGAAEVQYRGVSRDWGADRAQGTAIRTSRRSRRHLSELSPNSRMSLTMCVRNLFDYR